MTSMAGRLIRLEERMPKGCPTCRSWGLATCQIVVQGADEEPIRPETCPDCRCHVLLTLIIIGTREDGPA